VRQVVGTILGSYHPHGDTAVYDALVRLAQDFSLRYPLVDGHGNFGLLDGDAAAAMRYTSAGWPRWRPTSSPSWRERRPLPAHLRREHPRAGGAAGAGPELLMNGTTGIAVGMANIPPHNVGELCRR
jgi:DNA gyrase subunit A